jgi:MFS family permease
MTIASESIARPQIAMGAAVVPLLALAVFINYVDRGNLATAAPLIQGELKLSGTQLGILISAFFWSYVPGQLVAGWLSERINAYRTLALGLAIWSLSTVATGLVSGFAALVILRILLGLGESVAFPCSSKLLAHHLPEKKLGVANALIATGLALGPAFGTFVGGMLMARLGWRAVFLAFGCVSLLWLVPWLAETRHALREKSDTVEEKEPSYLAILLRREAWGACFGHFCANYTFYFVISWLPLYLVKTRGFSLAQMAEIGGMIYVVSAASSLASGWIADRWMHRGASSNRVRKTLMIASCVGIAVAMLGGALGGPAVSVASLFLAGLAFGPGTATIYAIGQTLAGPRAAGKWVAMQNCVGNTAGIIAPIVTGALIDRTGQFTWAFALACAMSLAGVAFWGVMIPKIAPLTWTLSAKPV